MNDDTLRKRKFALIIIMYPFALILAATLANVFLFGVAPAVVALPDPGIVMALGLSAILLLANHTWLMTSTELTRLKYGLHATPEEWEASGRNKSDVQAIAAQELERRHNAHNNATENTVYFSILAPMVAFLSPDILAAQVWMIGFAVGRLGHSFSYLTGRDGLRGIAMSISLASLYGLAGYLAICLLI